MTASSHNIYADSSTDDVCAQEDVRFSCELHEESSEAFRAEWTGF